MWNPLEFYGKVKTGGEWDLKRGHRGSEASPYEPGGNFHFGAVAAAYGFPESIAKRGAGMYQMLKGISYPEWGNRKELGPARFPAAMLKPPYGDDPLDQYEIGEGYRYYNHYYPNQGRTQGHEDGQD